MPFTVPIAFEWIGVGVFALTGAMAAARHRMDPFGFVLLATVTAVGGGTLRDLLLGLSPVFWIQDPADIIVCVLIALATFLGGRRGVAALSTDFRQAILWADALGLALFAVTGTVRTLETGAGPIVAVALGTITATFGGIIRDLLCNETPLVLRQEIYVTAAAFGATVVAVSAPLMPLEIAMGAGFLCGFVLRALAIWRGWSLPRFPDQT